MADPTSSRRLPDFSDEPSFDSWRQHPPPRPSTRHTDVLVGTLSAIIRDMAELLCMPNRDVRDMLFG